MDVFLKSFAVRTAIGIVSGGSLIFAFVFPGISGYFAAAKYLGSEGGFGFGNDGKKSNGSAVAFLPFTTFASRGASQ